jgi:hypothetical protein
MGIGRAIVLILLGSVFIVIVKIVFGSCGHLSVVV